MNENVYMAYKNFDTVQNQVKVFFAEARGRSDSAGDAGGGHLTP